MQDAIAAAPFGSQIWVAEGTYKPTSSTGDVARSISFNLKNGVGIYGGFAGDETNLNQRKVVDGGTFFSNIADNNGGALYAGYSNSINLINTVFRSNKASSDGGAIYSYYTDYYTDNDSTIINSIFDSNSSKRGGAIYNNEASAVGINLTFANNQAESGAAVYSQGTSSHPTYANSIFWSNQATNDLTSTPIVRGDLNYSYEAEKYTVLNSDRDTITGEKIEGVKPVYRFFNTETGAHLYTMDENERNYIEANLANYSVEGIKYYAFESEPMEVETIPVYRMLNTNSGSHLYTIDQNELNYIQDNLPNFTLENKGEPAYHVLEL